MDELLTYSKRQASKLSSQEIGWRGDKRYVNTVVDKVPPEFGILSQAPSPKVARSTKIPSELRRRLDPNLTPRWLLLRYWSADRRFYSSEQSPLVSAGGSDQMRCEASAGATWLAASNTSYSLTAVHVANIHPGARARQWINIERP